MKKINTITAIMLIIAAVLTATAQDKGNETSKDNALRGSGRVNPSTLGMEFQLELGTYPGRGIDIPVSLSYSSKLWRLDYQGNWPVPGSGYSDCRKHYLPRFGEKSASGWTTSLATPYIEYVGGKNFYNSDGSPVSFGDCPSSTGGNDNYPNHYVRRIVVHLPSGETHELRPDDSIIQFTNGSNTDPARPWNPANWDAVYYAADGSNLVYKQNDENNVYRLLMPDGSYYDFDPAPTATDDRKALTLTDRNGNQTTYHGPTTAFPNGYWTDTLGRTFAVPFAVDAPPAATPANAPQEYSMPGMTGKYKLHWKYLKGSSPSESAISDFNLPLKYLGESYTCANQSGNPTYCTHPSGTYLFTGNDQTRIISNYPFNPILLTEIELPTGLRYRFSYDGYGQLEKIEYPTGGVETFAYNRIPTLSMLDPDDAVGGLTNFGVTERNVFENADDTTPYRWNYTAQYVTLQSGYKVTITNPDRTRAERELHRGYDAGSQAGLFGYDNGLAGMVYVERGYDAANRLLSKKITNWAKTTLFTSGGTPSPVHWHPRVEQVESIAYDTAGNGVSSTTNYEFEDAANLNLRSTPVLTKRSIEYPFVVAGNPLPAAYRSNESTFFIYDTNIPQSWRDIYKDRNMVGLVNAAVVRDAAGTVLSRSETKYDETGYSPELGRANPTSLRVWDSTKGPYTDINAYIQTRARFDGYGNQYESIDARGNVVSTTFDSIYHAYPVKVTGTAPDPTGQHGADTGFVSLSTFDPVTGLPLATTDANNLETRIEYDPATLRPLRVKKFYQNTQVGGTVETVYHDEQNNCWVKNRAQFDANNWDESIAYFDGLGRAYKSEEINSNGNVYREKEFDPDGRVLRVSNPYRAGEIKKWTTNVYDQASRIIEVILQDGSKVKTDYSVSTSGVIGVTKTITDQAGKKRMGYSDSLGRMVRVVEDPGGQDTETRDLVTDYVFDILGNLRKTIQGEQSRYFTFDSLGRLLYSKQPEQDARAAFNYTDPVTGNSQWSVKYEYDDNGNITKMTDARGVFAEGTYDNLNRLKSRSYSDDTPDTAFWYDGKGLVAEPAFSKGKTTRIASSESETRYMNFNHFGQLLTSEQRTPFGNESTANADPKVSTYRYDAFGRLLSQTYPSGRKVEFEYNLDGDISSIRGTTTTGQNRLYLNGITYNSAGQMTRLRLGNGKWESTDYNDRLQVTGIGLGNSAADSSVLKLEYGYGDSTTNNGSLRSQRITFAGQPQAYEQTYTYDDLNRLKSAEEKTGTTVNWKQAFVYDRYGNRTFDAANTTTIGQSNTVTNPSANTATNRLSGYSYDPAGNLTVDAENRRFLYDADNHQTKFFGPTNNSTTPDAIYKYDGEGRRVKKISSTETTIFVYDGGGTLVAEYTALTGNDPAPTPQVSYLTQDHLGSPRVTTNQNGAVIKRSDWMAFGEEVEFNKRPTGVGYDSVTETRKGYTGYEKDDESGLDFAQARYYNPKHGRYTSVDPLTASANVRNPQTFNRYVYVINSPYKFTDPLGLISSSTGACGEWCPGVQRGGEIPFDDVNGRKDPDFPDPAERDSAGPADGETTPNPAASAPSAAGGDDVILIPGVTNPEVSLIYEVSKTVDARYDAKTGMLISPEIPAVNVALPNTSAVVTDFVKAISPYVQTTAVLNMIEEITATALESITSSRMAEISVTIAKAFGAEPSVSASGEGTLSSGISTTDSGASTLPARTEQASKIAAITLEYQDKIVTALANDRANAKMSQLSAETLINHAQVSMNIGVQALRERIQPRIDAAKKTLKPLLAK